MEAARKYPDELRDRAIRLVLNMVKDQDASVTAACRKVGGELGIKPDTLRGWAKQAQVDRGIRPGTSTADAARIRALERENADFAGSTRFCARRALFSRPSSTTGNPGGGLHRGLPGPVRGRAYLPGTASGRGAPSRRRGTTRPGRGRRGRGQHARPRWRNRSCGSIRTAGNGTARGRCGTSSTARASRRPGAPWSG